ncbi:Spy/CpxP family protein refolding chaperone [Sulfurimonas sp.]
MNKKIILSLASALLLSTAVFASGMNSENNKGTKKEFTKKIGKKNHGKSRVMSMMMRLDLSDEQKAKIKELKKQNMQNIPKTSDAFSESGFDKDLYIKLSKEKRDNMIQNKANMIEGMYQVLTPSQKKEFKEMLSQKRMMKNSKR